MENIQATSYQELPDGMSRYILTTFNSENEMKTYYLQMSNVMRGTHSYSSTDSEYICLKRLNNKIKQYNIFLQALGDHKWEKGIADIQKALGIFLMQNDIDSKIRKQTNQEIASLLQFIVFLSGNVNIIKQLQGIFHHHSSNITHLLKSVPTHSQILE